MVARQLGKEDVLLRDDAQSAARRTSDATFEGDGAAGAASEACEDREGGGFSGTARKLSEERRENQHDNEPIRAKQHRDPVLGDVHREVLDGGDIAAGAPEEIRVEGLAEVADGYRDALGYRWSLMSVVTAAMEPLELVVVSCIVYQSFESCCEPGPKDNVDL